MNIPYIQLSPEEALRLYCDWLLEQQTDDPFFRCMELGRPMYEWYMIFYPVRALLMGGKIFDEERYIDTAIKYVDLYLTEQLPNGGFTSNFRKTPTEKLTKKEFQDILRNGKVNIADNGSNVTAIIQAIPFVSGEKKERYIEAVRRWFDNWVAIWALPEGGYGNGIWVGHKLNSPYTCAMGTVSTAFSIFTRVTDEREYVENAEKCMTFQCSKWLEDGRPINLDAYPLPEETVLDDFGHSFYLMEGMCWTHSVTEDPHVKGIIESRLKSWIFGKKGLLSQWANSWFNYMVLARNPDLPSSMKIIRSSRTVARLGWEMAKSNGIIHLFLYYLNHIEDNPLLREKIELGIKYLTHPLKARMGGVMSDPDESYGAFAVQATGFGGLSLAEALQKDSVFLVE